MPYLIFAAPDEALIQQQAILEMPEPNALDMDYLQRFLVTKEMNWVLRGSDAETWGSLPYNKEKTSDETQQKQHIIQSPDLIALKPRTSEDLFSKWVGEKAIYSLGLHKFRSPSRKHGIVAFTQEGVLRFTSWVASALVSLLLILSTIVLYETDSMRTKLLLIAAFNVAGSIVLAVFTSAKRAEAFGILAA